MNKTIHMAKMINQNGDVASLCSPARKINLKRATWTNRKEAVNCNRCLVLLRMLAEREAQP